jgi:hypothetical protein
MPLSLKDFSLPFPDFLVWSLISQPIEQTLQSGSRWLFIHPLFPLANHVLCKWDLQNCCQCYQTTLYTIQLLPSSFVWLYRDLYIMSKNQCGLVNKLSIHWMHITEPSLRVDWLINSRICWWVISCLCEIETLYMQSFYLQYGKEYVRRWAIIMAWVFTNWLLLELHLHDCFHSLCYWSLHTIHHLAIGTPHFYDCFHWVLDIEIST